MKKRKIILVLLALMAVLGYVQNVREKNAAVSQFDVKKTFTPIIDAGHGGFDGGAVAPNGKNESEYNLEIALRTELTLRFLGLSPIMTRTEDTALNSAGASIREKKRSDLTNRVKLVEETQNPVLISIHQNKFEESKYSGAQVFHNGKPESAALAEAFQKSLREELDPGNNRQIKKASGVFLLDSVDGPAVLIECGFLSNPGELARLGSPEYQLKLAMVISSVYNQWSLY